MKRHTFIVLLSVFAFFPLLSCKNDPNLVEKNTVLISIYGDEHISVKKDSIEVKKSSKWRQIRRKVLSVAEYDSSYVISEVMLEEAGEHVPLEANYSFEKDVDIYITSRLKNNEANDDKVEIIIEIAGDKHINIEKETIEVQKGVKWQDIKDDVEEQLTFEEGYELKRWKISSSRGRVLQDKYIFKKDTKIYAMSQKTKNNDVPSPDEPNPADPSPDEPIESEPWEPVDETKINDEELIDVTPPLEGFVCPAIDYLLPQHPEWREKELWEGIFKSGKRYYILPYKMAKYELTYRLWKEVYEWAVKKGYVFSNKGSRLTQDNVVSDKLPIINVSWRDAIVWCNAYTQKLNNSTEECVYLNASNHLPLKDASDGESLDAVFMDFSKHGMRLPKEEEWEYAARCQMQKNVNAVNAGSVYLTKLDSCSGALFPIATPKTWSNKYREMYGELISTTVCQWFLQGHIPMRVEPKIYTSQVVARKKANYLGFYDMSGNVAELCTEQTKDDIFGIADKEGNYCIVRGGAWNSFSYDCSVGRRFSLTTATIQNNLGFRLCQTK